MATVSWKLARSTRLFVSKLSNHARVTSNIAKLNFTHSCVHSRSSPCVFPRLNTRYYATSNEETNKNSVVQQIEEQQKKEDEEAKKHRESQWWWTKIWFSVFGGSLTLCVGYTLYDFATPPLDERGIPMVDEFSSLPPYQRYMGRIRRELNYYINYFEKPSRDKLLPDPLTYPYIQPPYTLVLEFRDLLVHPDWTYQTGWRFKKRPGVDYFLEQVAPPLFEVVVYTSEPGMSVFPILDALDPNGYIMYRLVRDATEFVDGQHVKALDHLNRDLSKVIVVDWNSKSVKDHPRNTLLIPRWSGNDDDTTLIDLAAFLKMLATNKVEDVREVLDYYQQFEDPIQAFRENQRKVLEQLEKSEKERKDKTHGLAQRWRPTFLNKPSA